MTVRLNLVGQREASISCLLICCKCRAPGPLVRVWAANQAQAGRYTRPTAFRLTRISSCIYCFYNIIITAKQLLALLKTIPVVSFALDDMGVKCQNKSLRRSSNYYHPGPHI